MRTKKGQRVNSILELLLCNKNTVNWDLMTVWRWPSRKQYLEAFKTSNIILQNTRVCLLLSLKKTNETTPKSKPADWTVVAHWSGFPWKAIWIYWSSSLRMSIRNLFSSLTINNSIPILSGWVTSWFNSRGSKSGAHAESSCLLHCGTDLILWYPVDPGYQGGDSIHCSEEC